MGRKMIRYVSLNDYERVFNEETGEFEHVQFSRTCQATEQEVEFLNSINIDFMYSHMRQAIGIMTHEGKTRFIPTLYYGKIRISLQINYQLFSLRFDENRSKDNSPITEEEFDKLVDKEGHKYIDVKVWYGDTVFIKATTMTLSELKNALNNAVCDEDCD